MLIGKLGDFSAGLYLNKNTRQFVWLATDREERYYLPCLGFPYPVYSSYLADWG